MIDFDSRSFAILLTNRVHPSRNWGSNNPARRAVVQGLALSLGVGPQHGRDAWFSGTTDASTTTLAAKVAVPAAGAKVSFDLFVDTEDTDLLYLESSTDGTTWTKVPFTVRDRGTVIDYRRLDQRLRRPALAPGLCGARGRRADAALALHLGPAVPGPRGLRGRREDLLGTQGAVRRRTNA